MDMGDKDMEMIGIIAGMILAFLAGAYVRKPFVLAKKEKEEIPAEPMTEENKLSLEKQMENLLDYNGRNQENGE